MTEQKEFVDFNVGLGDNGEDNLAAIQPLSDGEGATQVVLRRPSENLRERTETLRDVAEELLYYRDYSHLMIEYTGGTITWNGAAPGAPPLGKISVTAGSFTVTPMLAPYQAKKGTLSVGTPSSNRVIYTVAATSYATHGMNAVTIKHLHSASAGSVSVAISAGPVKRIVVTLNTSTASHDAAAVQTALASAIAADTILVGRLVITTSAVANVAVIALAETRLDTTADDEKHVIAGSDIQTLTTTTPLQPGMGIAIWYKYVIEPAGFGADPKGGLAGGRAESSGDRGTSAIPAAALFVTHVSPDKIPGAIPLCRIGYNGQLIWYDGTRLEAGESFQFKSPTSVASIALAAHVALQASVLGAATVGYNGSGPWADGSTAVTASTVETALDEIVADLADMTATLPGAIRVGVDAPTIFGTALTAQGGGGALTTNTTIRSALSQLHSSAIARRAFTAVCTDGTNSVGGDINVVDVVPAINTLAATGGTYLLRRGAYNVSTNFTTSKNTHLIGEDNTKVTLTLTKSGHVTFLGADANDEFSFENIFLKGSAAGVFSYYFTGGSYKLHNCRATAGAFQFQPTGHVRVDIDNLVIDDDTPAGINWASIFFYHTNPANTNAVTGTLRRLRVTAIPSGSSGATQKYALLLVNIGTKAASRNYEPLVIEDSIFDISAGFGDVGVDDGSVACMSSVHQPQIYRNCIFRCSQSNASITPTVLTITNSTNIEFDNCTFIQDGYGKVLAISGDSNHIRFRSCKFYTSTVAVNYPEIGVVCSQASATDPGQNIVFEDCYVELRFGTVVGGAATRRVEIGSVAGVSTGNGSYTLDGFHLNLNYANITQLASHTLSLLTGTVTSSTINARNITVDLQGKRLAGAASNAIVLDAPNSGNLTVNGLHVKNVTEPDTSAGATTLTCSLISVGTGVRITGGSINGTPAGSNVSAWLALYDLSTAATVEGISFYENSGTANKGRLFRATTRGKVLGNTVNGALFATGENTPGWFAYITGNQAKVAHNTIHITGSAQNLLMATANHALVYAEQYGAIITGNNARCNTAAVKFLTIDRSDCTVTANTVMTFSAGADTAVLLDTTSSANVVTGNTFTNGDTGTLLVVNNGNISNYPNLVFGNSDGIQKATTRRLLNAIDGEPLNPSQWTKNNSFTTAITLGATYAYSLNTYVPNGAVIREINALVLPTTNTDYTISGNRMSIKIYTLDNVGAITVSLAPVFDPIGVITGDRPISSGTISVPINKSIATVVAYVVASAGGTVSNVLYSLEVVYDTPKFYMD